MNRQPKRPIQSAAPPHTSSPQNDTGTTAAKIRVLIADDHAVVREGLVAMIGRQADMTVVAEAQNGRDAVALWRDQRPNVALLDLRMPQLDGIGAIEEIRALDPTAHYHPDDVRYGRR